MLQQLQGLLPTLAASLQACGHASEIACSIMQARSLHEGLSVVFLSRASVGSF